MLTKCLTQQELKAELLAMLDQFDSLCKRENLRYSLAGGSLLGAVRHKGFIPWDDDIDLAMPRPDFEKLITISKTGQLPNGYSLVPFSKNWKHPVFLKFTNENISIDAKFESGVGSLWIDVIPVDGLPENSAELNDIYRRVTQLQRRIMFCNADKHQGKNLVKCALKSVCVPLVNFAGILPKCTRELDLLSRRYAFGETEWCGCIAWGLYGSGERYAVEGWKNISHLEFEKRQAPAIGCWNEYLTGIYGDYMTLPPENQRINHHLKAWRNDEMDHNHNLKVSD